MKSHKVFRTKLYFLVYELLKEFGYFLQKKEIYFALSQLQHENTSSYIPQVLSFESSASSSSIQHPNLITSNLDGLLIILLLLQLCFEILKIFNKSLQIFHVFIIDIYKFSATTLVLKSSHDTFIIGCAKRLRELEAQFCQLFLELFQRLTKLHL